MTGSARADDILESGCFLTIGTNKTADKVDVPAFSRLCLDVARNIDTMAICKLKGVVEPFVPAQEADVMLSIEEGGKFHRIHCHFKIVFYSRGKHAFLDGIKLRGFLSKKWPSGLYINQHRFVTERSLSRYINKSKAV